MPTVKELPPKVKILIARLSYNGYERVEIANWLVQTALALHEHPRVGDVAHNIVTGYPTPRVRNQVLVTAKKIGAHFAVMIDDDMVPDVHAPGRAVGYGHLDAHGDQTTFFPSALDFALSHVGPCVVAAPYCAGPPEERVLVSRFREDESDNPNSPTKGIALRCFSRDEAAERTGFEMVSALPTGLMLIDMRGVDMLSPPWFDYEYETSTQDVLASTEDTVFSRNLMYIGVPQYISWNSWAAHVKSKVVGRPLKYPLLAIPQQVERTLREQMRKEEREARPADRANTTAKAYLAALESDDAEPLKPLADDDDCHP